ncbi:acetyl-CoA carboxylase carboxyltransferase subunit alpha [Paenibacillus taichungensis]|uniref:acetyl-CoA carboxylase carboxyltransferase subunit alpha n=1 Tax=Paenibacillus TaxID=44249 RepID=UPI00096D2503|nr:acetyl-CoA carboxylase carboxyltransferase subunit alpha [Paenibacillus taichungensis]MEC0111204.1 acetyl-CoA carboxylase carboxyltransferase subunit alpha [Paenibacillus taichungensis]MEC0200866.1 acetyl-CoA carboxylase carboxyltransferase subunit alpha [Paenibacillus taichungensis]OME83638.1 acetyl-CoA carboxylase carboxyltransferase subunit alpha [Paenibacillus pabuli]
MSYELPFEGSLNELKRQINELKSFALDINYDLTEEVQRLEERYNQIEEEMYTGLSAYEKLQMARHPMRPAALDYFDQIFDKFIELHGDRLYGDDDAIVGGLARFNGTTVTVVGHQKGKDMKDNLKRNFGMPHPEGYRKALRLMKQAEKFKRPIITFIDTPGAYPGMAAEERGQSGAIAINLLEMSKLKVPIICIVIGEGGSGGALALGVGDRLLMLENAVYAVASPNAAASILLKDAGRVSEVTEALKITSNDLMEYGIIDEIIPEPRGGAHKDFEGQADIIKKYIHKQLIHLNEIPVDEMVNTRIEKVLHIGRYLEVSEELTHYPDI